MNSPYRSQVLLRWLNGYFLLIGDPTNGLYLTMQNSLFQGPNSTLSLFIQPKVTHLVIWYIFIEELQCASNVLGAMDTAVNGWMTLAHFTEKTEASSVGSHSFSLHLHEFCTHPYRLGQIPTPWSLSWSTWAMRLTPTLIFWNFIIMPLHISYLDMCCHTTACKQIRCYAHLLLLWISI